MCAMTGLNIQYLPLFEYGVIIWQVFIRMLGYYGTKLAGSIVKNLCKTQESGAAATLPQRGEGISNYNQIIYNNQPSPQPSPTGEEVSNYKMLKQVQHDTNSSKRTYSPIHLFSYSPCKRCAFTLAEVLITLGIIGVVAAMTMPSLIANHREKQIVAQLKKTYSVLQQAFLQAEVKHGEAKYWGDIVGTNTGETDENGDPILDYSTTINVLNYIAENINVQRSSADLVYTPVPMNENTGTEFRIPAERYLKLNDGTIVGGGYSSAERTTMDISVILPKCLKRGKCKYGIDIFYFKIDLANSRIIPFGIKEDLGLNTNSFEQMCNKSIENSQQGFGCTAWVLYNENMDYLHCDDLSWEGKTKCN